MNAEPSCLEIRQKQTRANTNRPIADVYRWYLESSSLVRRSVFLREVSLPWWWRETGFGLYVDDDVGRFLESEIIELVTMVDEQGEN